MNKFRVPISEILLVMMLVTGKWELNSQVGQAATPVVTSPSQVTAWTANKAKSKCDGDGVPPPKSQSKLAIY